MKKLVMLATFALAACGGGGSGGTTTALPPPRVQPLYFGYYGTDQGQIATTVPAVNLVDCQDFASYGDPAGIAWEKTQLIECLQQAKADGVKVAVLGVGFLLYDAHFKYLGPSALAQFKLELDAADLTGMVTALYPLDEPDIHHQSDAQMTQVFRDCKAVFPQSKIAVIYSNSGRTPGIAEADWVGMDDYSRGAGVLGELPSIRADQQYLLVPGGANPWRQDPGPFYQFALQNADVVGIVAFLYEDFPYQGQLSKGIGSNGMLAAYQAVGCKVTGKC